MCRMGNERVTFTDKTQSNIILVSYWHKCEDKIEKDLKV